MNSLSPTPQQRQFKPGQSVYREGEHAETLYRVDQGVFRMVRHTPEGRTLTLRFVLPGEYFGEDALLCSERRAEVLALTPGRVQVLSSTLEDPEELRRVTQSISEQLRRLTLEGHYSGSSGARGRVAQFLLRSTETPLAQQDRYGEWTVNATHELIAQTVGCTREHVSKVMRELRDGGLVSCLYAHVTLHRLDRLREIAALE